MIFSIYTKIIYHIYIYSPIFLLWENEGIFTQNPWRLLMVGFAEDDVVLEAQNITSFRRIFDPFSLENWMKKAHNFAMKIHGALAIHDMAKIHDMAPMGSTYIVHVFFSPGDSPPSKASNRLGALKIL